MNIQPHRLYKSSNIIILMILKMILGWRSKILAIETYRWIKNIYIWSREHFCSPREHFCSPRQHFWLPREHFCSPREQFCSPRKLLFIYAFELRDTWTKIWERLKMKTCKKLHAKPLHDKNHLNLLTLVKCHLVCGSIDHFVSHEWLL